MVAVFITSHVIKSEWWAPGRQQPASETLGALGDRSAEAAGSSGFPQGPTGSAPSLGHCWSPPGISHHSRLFQGPPGCCDSAPTRSTAPGPTVCGDRDLRFFPSTEGWTLSFSSPRAGEDRA